MVIDSLPFTYPQLTIYASVSEIFVTKSLELPQNLKLGRRSSMVNLHFVNVETCRIETKLGDDWAFLVLLSDGISSVLSDDEIVDLARGAADPKMAAERILSFSQEMGGQDNATVIVVPLAGWGKVDGPDKTRDLREYRRKQAGTYFYISFVLRMLNTL